MPLNEPSDRTALRRETELERCLRIYKNDSLISWHLGISKAEVAAARDRLKPQRVRGEWISKSGEIDENEFARRKVSAAQSNVNYLAAVQRMQANG